MAELKKLPIGLQAFDKILKGDYLYIDKTQLILDLIQTQNASFIARPRRFGKSLLLSTMQAIFEGKRELFSGLAIDQFDYDWQHHPIIKLTMSNIKIQKDKSLNKPIFEMLSDCAQFHGIEIEETSSPGRFLIRLVQRLNQKYNTRVVILIDEYDKPILDVINQPEMTHVRDELHNFYVVLKDLDHYLRFLFLTGVSRFSRTSIFSGLNQLTDISNDPKYSTLCGYTDEEVDHYFVDHIQTMQEATDQHNIREKLRTWYDGYKFHATGPAMYNPFSLMSALQSHQWENYWFSSGTPTFLVSLLRENKFDLQSLDELVMSSRQMSEMAIEQLELIPVLYQTGYITIDTYSPRSQIYKLTLPNYEVRISLFECLIRDYMKQAGMRYSSIQIFIAELEQYLVNNDLNHVIEMVKTIYAKIPYTIHIDLERYYQTIFYMIFLLSGFDIIVEEATNDGRIDIVVTTPTHRYIIELKLNKNAQEALNQIKQKQYAAKYADDKRSIILIGINFDSEKRMIDDWLYENVD